MKQLQTAWPDLLTQPLAVRASGSPVTIFPQDETRLGVWPLMRRRIPASGVPPMGTVPHKCDNFSLCGAGEPTPGDSFFLELPSLNRHTFPLWWDGCSEACADSCNIVGLDKGAFHNAKAVQWPSHVVPLFLPPYSPELNPIERLWRDLKDQLADLVSHTIEELSDAVCTIIQRYSKTVLQTLTGFTYFVQAVETARKAYV